MTGIHVDFFGLPSQLAALAQPAAEPAREARRLVARAWYLRQRNTGAAQADAATAQHLLGSLPVDEAQNALGRLTLLQAENAWLFGDQDKTAHLIDQARQIFMRSQDPIGLGDCLLCEASHLETDTAQRLTAVRAAGAAYSQASDGGDLLRRALVEVWCLSIELDAPSRSDPAPWLDRLAQANRLGHPGIDHFVALTHAALAHARNQRVLALEHLHAAFSAAQAAGHVFWALHLAHDMAQAFGQLGDETGAQQWAQCAHDLAQPTGWPHAASRCVVYTAKVHLDLGQAQAARHALMNGLPTLQRFPLSPDYVQAALLLGRALLALREPQDALAWLKVSERMAQQLRLSGDRSTLLCLRARALSQLGRADEAWAAANAALDTVQGHTDVRQEAGILHLMAELARAHGMASPAQAPQGASQEVHAASHYLRQAFTLAEQTSGFFVPPAWHAELSQDHEAVGDLALALQHQRQATAGFEQMRRQQRSDLAAAMQLRQRVQADHLRVVQRHAAARARHDRADAQQQQQTTLERLALAHQALACCTSLHALFTTLELHLVPLLEASSMAMWLQPDPLEEVLELAWGHHDTQPMPPMSLPAGDGESPVWRCLRTQQEHQLDGLTTFVANAGATVLKGPVHGSALLLPLLAGADTLGVWVLQTRRAGAYAEHERALPRQLAAAMTQTLARLIPRDTRLALELEPLKGVFERTLASSPAATEAPHHHLTIAKLLSNATDSTDSKAHPRGSASVSGSVFTALPNGGGKGVS